MKTSTTVFLSCVMLSILIGGCSQSVEQPVSMSNMQITTARDPQATFPGSAKYAFLRTRPEDLYLDAETEEIMRRVRDAIKSNLKSKGYKPGGDSIDFIVDYQLVAQQNMSILAERIEREGEKWITVVGVPDNFIQGSLVIDVIDAKDLTPVWRGLCNVDVALDEVSEEEKNLRAQFAVQELLKDFPPKK